MQASRDSNLISKIFVAVLVISSSVGIWSIVWDIWYGHSLTVFERIFMGIIVLVLIGGIFYVLIQRKQMKNNETFRREKW